MREDDLSHGNHRGREPTGRSAGSRWVRTPASLAIGVRRYGSPAVGPPCHGGLTGQHQPFEPSVELVRVGVEKGLPPAFHFRAVPPAGPGPPRLPLRGATAGAPRSQPGASTTALDEGEGCRYATHSRFCTSSGHGFADPWCPTSVPASQPVTSAVRNLLGTAQTRVDQPGGSPTIGGVSGSPWWGAGIDSASSSSTAARRTAASRIISRTALIVMPQPREADHVR